MRWLTLACLMLAACGPGALSGKVDGHNIGVRSAVFATFEVTGEVEGVGQAQAEAVQMIISDDANTCAHVLQQGTLSSSYAYVVTWLVQPYYEGQSSGMQSGAPPVDAGYYVAQGLSEAGDNTSGGQAFSYFWPAHCSHDDTNYVVEEGLSGGFLIHDITRSAGGSLDVDVDVKYGENADELKGSIQATYCTGLTKLAQAAQGYQWDCQ